MRIGGGGSRDVNQLQSDAATFRNRDFVVDQAGAFTLYSAFGSIASEYPHIQLINPVGSTITVLLDQVTLAVTTDSICYYRWFDTELTTDISGWRNVKAGEANGQAHLRRETNTSLLGTALEGAYLAANTPWLITLESPVELPPGSGVMAVGGTVQSLISAGFRGREV